MDKEIFARRVRVRGNHDSTAGYMVALFDADTGEAIVNAFKVDVHLEVSEVNTAQITYYETNEQGNIAVGNDRKPITHAATVEVSEIDVTAMESSRQQIGPYEIVCKDWKDGPLLCIGRDSNNVSIDRNDAIALIAYLKRAYRLE